MASAIKNEAGKNNSTPTSQTKKSGKTTSAKKKTAKPTPKKETYCFYKAFHRLRISLLGKNDYYNSLLKSFYELLIDEDYGRSGNDYRFVEKYKAANLLFPEHRKALKGLIKFY